MKVFLLLLHLAFRCSALVPGLDEKSSSVSSEEFNHLRNEVRSISNQLNEKEDQVYVLLNRLNEKEGEITRLENRVKDLEHSKSISESSAKDQSYAADTLLFVVYGARPSNEGWFVPKGRIPLNPRMNINHCFGAGIFSAPTDGLYIFSFSGHIAKSEEASIGVYVNDEDKLWFSDDLYDYGHDDYGLSTFTFSIELKQDDELYLLNYYDNSLWVDDWREMTFTGRYACTKGGVYNYCDQ